jgi:hypothetical protein
LAARDPQLHALLADNLLSDPNARTIFSPPLGRDTWLSFSSPCQTPNLLSESDNVLTDLHLCGSGGQKILMPEFFELFVFRYCKRSPIRSSSATDTRHAYVSFFQRRNQALFL